MGCTQNMCDVVDKLYHVVCIVSHGLCDGTLEIGVPYFVDVVENGSKTRISNFFRPLKEVLF
ncbi:hypothetical protein PFNF54_00002 [Plasmodium falciparum NF54]|uniref:Uncharacterized protein n=1 Tax=Plasmodium falciparum (isolate NF54) TaxID=5843 RepID=W7KNK6_PLAFO|nr:hypothetical protein PFNF54_00002 [Plasmodium falciparum NF54]